jgi:putative photosynthetic complex assembly protein 2
VSLALPILATVALWFASTALIVWLAHRPSATYRRSLVLGGGLGLVGLLLILLTADRTDAAAHYAAFAGALLIWGWHELAFLTGAVTGPRRRPAAGERSWPRFRAATAALIHHELALAATAVILLALDWNAANPTGAHAFALLLALRLSAKFNIFLGVPNLSDELLPAHLAYLKSYFGAPQFHAALMLSLLACAALTLWLGARALAAPGDVGAALLFTLGALGLLEHLFLALPVRDGALWRWAIPARPKSWGGGYGL